MVARDHVFVIMINVCVPSEVGLQAIILITVVVKEHMNVEHVDEKYVIITL